MSIKTASLGAASLLAAAAFAGSALADGMPSRGRIAPAPEGRTCSTTANVGLTTDYVFRGISQSNENAAVQGGVDFSCGRFYAGVWASSIYGDEATTEVDLYGGFRHTTGRINWDFGFIYYTYPGEPSSSAALYNSGFGNYLELKASASGEVWKGGTLAGTVFYSPDYLNFLGATWTLEGSFTQALPKVGMFSPTFGATIGRSYIDKFDGDLDYTYWNVGLTLGFLEKWSVDIRYWGTDGNGVTEGNPRADDRVVGTVKYTF
jgi:uncharacterized protein (TIGR02001 family)